MRQIFINFVVTIWIFLTRTKAFFQKRWLLLTTLAVIGIALYLFNISLTIEIKRAGELLWTIG